MKNRKSNAYFGKSLVRLACNEEKNREKSDDNNTERKNKLTEELNSHQMKHTVIQQCVLHCVNIAAKRYRLMQITMPEQI